MPPGSRLVASRNMMFREIWKELSMSATAPTAVKPIAFRQDEGEALWFLGVLATIKASPHLHRHLTRGTLPARHRARRIRRIHARPLRTGTKPHPPARNNPPSRPRANDGYRDRVRHRDPRPAGHPHLKSAPSTRSAL